MENNFDIQSYVTRGVERIVADAIRATLRNPKESAFMIRFAAASKRASQKRKEAEAVGTHIPPLLIASITSECNLHCKGCYSRGIHTTTDQEPLAQLTAEEWGRVFAEAEELGFSFVILVGGEPMLRRDVIETAGNRPNILFPIFTNGTFLTEGDMELFDRCRNLIPIMSIEGGRAETDARRGEGIYKILINNMDEFQRRGLVFGASLTVTKDNLSEITSKDFLQQLSEQGCTSVIYIEYVPPTSDSDALALYEEESELLRDRIGVLRKDFQNMVFISFPGDEKASGGCVAAGRGLLHINSQGSAEPCPFSPFSDINVRDSSLSLALKSDFFRRLRSSEILTEAHTGGCVLHEKARQVEEMLGGKNKKTG